MEWLKYNTASQYLYTVLLAVGSRSAVSNPTISSGEVKISKDGGAFTNIGTLPTVVPSSNVQVQLTLSAAELSAKIITVWFHDTSGTPVWDDQYVQVCTYGNASAFFGFDFSQSTPAVNVTQIDGNATNGNNATLNLKQLNVVNNGGSAVIMNCTGTGASGGYGLIISGYGGLQVTGSMGDAVQITSNGSNGNGMNISGNGTGSGILSTGGATGAGVYVQGGATSGNGFTAYANGGNNVGFAAYGHGSGCGFMPVGGDTGAGIWARGGASGGDGVWAYGSAGNGNGLRATGNGSGSGLFVNGGTTGIGLYALGGSTSGHGAFYYGQAGNSHGLYTGGYGTGNGINITAGATGDGLVTQGVNGATIQSLSGNGNGIQLIGHTNGVGCYINGGSNGGGMIINANYGFAASLTGYGGLQITGTLGDAVQFQSTGGGGRGLAATGNGIGAGIFAQGGASYGSGMHLVGGSTSGPGLLVESSGGNTSASIYNGNGTGYGIQSPEIQAIEAKTDQLTFTVTNEVDSNITGINSSSTAAQLLALSAATMATGAIDTANYTPTTTIFDTTRTEAAASYWVSRWVVFTSGALIDQAQPVTAYQKVSGKGRFTCNAFAGAPSNGDTFIIV